MLKEKTSLNFGSIIAYGLGGMFPLGFVLCMASYVNLYMTDIAGFSVGIAAILYTAIQLIKMITMAFSGIIIDKVGFKKGRYRSWILISGIVLGLSFPFCFLYLDININIYIGIFVLAYFVQSLAYNISWTAQRAIIAPMSKNNADVVLLNTVAQFAGLFTSVVYMIVGSALLNIESWKDTKNMYFVPCCIYGLFIIFASIFMYVFCGKYENGIDAGEQKKKVKEAISLKDIQKAFRGNTIPFFFSYTFTGATQAFITALLGHFASYVLENPNVIALSGGVNAIMGVLGCVFTPILTKKLSKKNVHIVAQLISMLAYILLALLGKNQFLFIAFRGIATFMGMPSTIVMTAMANDIGDSIEMKGENSPRAFILSISGTAIKAGLVIAAAVGTYCLSAIGYEAGCIFTDSMKAQLTLLIAALPALCCALAVVFMFFYKIDENAIAEWKKGKE